MTARDSENYDSRLFRFSLVYRATAYFNAIDEDPKAPILSDVDFDRNGQVMIVPFVSGRAPGEAWEVSFDAGCEYEGLVRVHWSRLTACSFLRHLKPWENEKVFEALVEEHIPVRWDSVF